MENPLNGEFNNKMNKELNRPYRELPGITGVQAYLREAWLGIVPEVWTLVEVNRQ